MNRPERTFANREIRVERRLPTYWRVTFDLPPVNIFGPKETLRLGEIITAIERDEQVKVVVFDSAVDGFFITHYDFLAPLEESAKIPPGPTGLQALPDMLVRLSRAPVVSIASIRGARRESEASLRWQAICVSRAAKRLFCRNGRSERASCQAAGRWLGCRV
jgi:hypothetical protein